MVPRFPSLWAGFVVCACGLAIARPPEVEARQQQNPTFRNRVDVVQLDLSVLDKNGQPVKGLTAADFTVKDNGSARPIAGVVELDVPSHDESLAPWTREAPFDVINNHSSDGRLIAIIIDDATMPMQPYYVKHAKDEASKIVDGMGPQDLAAVLFARQVQDSQDFTRDRSKLRTAIDKTTSGFPLGDNVNTPLPGGPRPLAVVSGVDYVDFPYRALVQTVDYLQSIRSQRKIIVYISMGYEPSNRTWHTWQVSHDAIGPSMAVTPTTVSSALTSSAMLTNVTVFTMSPAGLEAEASPAGHFYLTAGPEYLRTLAGLTGGSAIINTNDPTPGIVSLFRQTSSYYLLGYESDSPNDGHYHHLEVKANRPNVTVLSRDMFLAPGPDAAARAAETARARAATGTLALDHAIADLLPASDLPMRATVAPFFAGGKAAVAVVEGFEPPPTAATPRHVDLQARVFSVLGKPQDTHAFQASIAQPSANGRYEAVERLDLKPGRYEIRLSAHDTASGLAGGVYTDVTVPDFAREKLSLSGVVISSASAAPVDGADALARLIPVTPTAERTFAASDRVTAFVRVYQGVTRPLSDARATMTVMDAHGTPVASVEKSLPGSVFSGIYPAAADVTFALPLANRAPGDYLMTIRAESYDGVATGQVRFRVR